MVSRLKFILIAAIFFTSFANAAPVITLSADEFSPGESITIKIKNLPGNDKDWLTLVKVDARASKFGEWSYTKGVTEGTWTFSAPKRPGDYEVRVFFDYPAGGETIHARAAVKVIAKKKSQPQTTVQASKPESETAPTTTLEQSQNEGSSAKLEDCPQDFPIYQCNMTKQYVGTPLSMKHGDVDILIKGVLQCFPRKCPNFNESTQPDKQKTSQHKKADTEPRTTEPTKDPKPSQSVTSVLLAEDLDESTPSGKTLATVHALLTPIDGGLGTAAQVMARIEPLGYKLKGKGSQWVAELNEHGGGRIYFRCGGNTCGADSEVTSIDYALQASVRGSPSTYELYGDFMTKSLAYMRGRLGQETRSGNITETSANLEWVPPSKVSHVQSVGMTVKQKKRHILLQMSIRKIKNQT